MAALTTDLQAVADYLRRAEVRECSIRSELPPEPMASDDSMATLIPYFGPATGAADVRAYASGWTSLDGVMLVSEETEFDADLRIAIAADNERALRDLLLAVPDSKSAFFYLAGSWPMAAVAQLIDGKPMPFREGYWASSRTLMSANTGETRRLALDDFHLVESQWDQATFEHMLATGHAVWACYDGQRLQAMCFSWEVESWRREVHGLQAVERFPDPFALSVVAAATADVVEEGMVATCTANLSDSAYLAAYRDCGYQLFYRVYSYFGAKRGTVRAALPEDPMAPRSAKRRSVGATASGTVPRQIVSGKDPAVELMTDLSRCAGRREHGQFAVEGPLLVRRALDDGLPVNIVLCTEQLLRDPEGAAVIDAARNRGVGHSVITSGLMGRVSSTRPAPSVAAAVFGNLCMVPRSLASRSSTLVVAENIGSPDNLGMVLRTSDAAGADAVVVAGDRCDPLHKHCIRAARGAVGRIPIYATDDVERFLASLAGAGIQVVGAALSGSEEIFRVELTRPCAIVIGNEHFGITPPVLAACTRLVRIPMAPGQDSLNVAVATGVLLYNIVGSRNEAFAD